MDLATLNGMAQSFKLSYRRHGQNKGTRFSVKKNVVLIWALGFGAMLPIQTSACVSKCLNVEYPIQKKSNEGV